MTPTLRLAAALALVVCATGASRAEDEALPRGAVTRLGSRSWRTDDEPRGVAVSPDGATVAAGGEGGVTFFTRDGVARRIPLDGGDCRVLSFTPDGASVVAASAGDADVALVDVASGAVTDLGVEGTAVAVAFRGVPGETLLALDDGSVLGVSGADRRLFVVSTEGSGAISLSRRGDRVARIVESKESGDPLVQVLDLTGKVLRSSGSSESSAMIALSPDGSRVAETCDDGRVLVTDVEDGRGRTLLGHSECVEAFAFSSDGARLVTLSGDRTVRVWDAASGFESSVARLACDLPDSPAIAIDGRTAYVTLDHSIARLDIDSGKLDVGSATAGGVEHLALSRDGRSLVAAASSGPPIAWDVAARTARMLPERHRGRVTGISFSPADDDVFASCSDGGDIRLWGFSTGATLPLPRGVTHGDAYGPDFSPDGRWLVAGARWGDFAYWDVASGRRVLADGLGRELDKKGADFRVAWSPDGTCVATAHGDGDVRFVPVVTDAKVDAYTVSPAPPQALSWSPDAEYVCVVAAGRVALRGRDGAVIAKRDGLFRSGAHSPVARVVAVGDLNGAVHLLVPPALDEIASVPAHRGEVRSLEFSGDGRRFATGGADGTIVVWDVAALAGAEPEPMKRATPSGVEPGPGRGRVFPPADLRVGRAEGLLPGESIEPYAGAIPGAQIGDDEVRAVLVVDGTSGLPLPGATLSLFEENLSGPPLPPYARATSDASGIAFAVWQPGHNFGHWLIEREGFAPVEVFAWDKLPRTVVLQPLPDLVGRILDPYGRPVAGGAVELFLGCGHSPTVARATTGDDGVFRLRGCDASGGNMVVLAPGASAEYLGAWMLGKLGEEPVTFVLKPGADVRGRVVDLDGWGVAGLPVKGGPERTITTTEADGTFVLRGVAPNDTIEFAGSNWMSLGGRGVNWSRPDVPLAVTMTLDEEPEVAAGRPVRFATELADRDTDVPVRPDGCVLVSQTTGIRYFPQEEEDEGEVTGIVRFEAPEGLYVLVPGSPFAPYAGEPFPVRVGRDQHTRQRVPVTAQPRLAVRFEGDPPDGADAEVVAAGEVWPVDERAALSGVFVPADAPAAVVLREGALQRAFPLGPASDGRREAVVAWPRPKRIRISGVVGKEVSIDGQIEATKVAEDAGAGTCEIETHASGALHFVIDDDGEGLAIVDVVVPADSGATVDAQVRRLPPTSFALRTADGKPLTEASVRCALWSDGAGEAKVSGSDASGEDGRVWLFGAANAPCVVELRPESWAPRRIVVRSDGEQIVSWGDAALTVELRDDAGKPLDGVLVVDGIVVDAPKGLVELRGMDSGRHTLLAAAKDRQPQTIDLSLGRTATRTIRVVLPEIGK